MLKNWKILNKVGWGRVVIGVFMFYIIDDLVGLDFLIIIKLKNLVKF